MFMPTSSAFDVANGRLPTTPIGDDIVKTCATSSVFYPQRILMEWIFTMLATWKLSAIDTSNGGFAITILGTTIVKVGATSVAIFFGLWKHELLVSQHGFLSKQGLS